MGNESDSPQDGMSPTRRKFLKRMAAFAFVTPVVSTFGMNTLASAGTSRGSAQRMPNQPPPRNQRRSPGTDNDDDDPFETRRGRG